MASAVRTVADVAAVLHIAVGDQLTEDSVRAAYRQRALLCHPDRPGGSVAQFREVHAAYEWAMKKVEATPVSRVSSLIVQPRGHAGPSSVTRKAAAAPVSAGVGASKRSDAASSTAASAVSSSGSTSIARPVSLSGPPLQGNKVPLRDGSVFVFESHPSKLGSFRCNDLVEAVNTAKSTNDDASVVPQRGRIVGKCGAGHLYWIREGHYHPTVACKAAGLATFNPAAPTMATAASTQQFRVLERAEATVAGKGESIPSRHVVPSSSSVSFNSSRPSQHVDPLATQASNPLSRRAVPSYRSVAKLEQAEATAREAFVAHVTVYLAHAAWCANLPEYAPLDHAYNQS